MIQIIRDDADILLMEEDGITVKRGIRRFGTTAPIWHSCWLCENKNILDKVIEVIYLTAPAGLRRGGLFWILCSKKCVDEWHYHMDKWLKEYGSLEEVRRMCIKGIIKREIDVL